MIRKIAEGGQYFFEQTVKTETTLEIQAAPYPGHQVKK